MPGELKAIWIKRIKQGPMDPVEKAALIENKGIVDNANVGGKRQVTIIVEEVWQELMEETGAKLDPSSRRANLLVSNIQLQNSHGKILQVGDCKIRIYGETKPCEQMNAAFQGLREAMVPGWRGGAYGVVLNSGEIRIGDRVELTED